MRANSRGWSAGLLAAGAVLSASAAQAEDLVFCHALRAVREEAKGAHEPFRITAEVAPGPGGALTCRPALDAPALRSFCDAAVASVGAEGGHMLAWRVFQCVDTVISGSTLTTTDEVIGPRNRRKISHVAADMGGGVRLDLSQPAASPGRYDLVIWRPR